MKITGIQTFVGNLENYPSEKQELVELLTFEKNPTGAIKDITVDRSMVQFKNKFNQYIYNHNLHKPQEYYSSSKLYFPFPPMLHGFLNGMKNSELIPISEQFVSELDRHYETWNRADIPVLGNRKKLLTVSISKEMIDDQDIGEDNVEIYYLYKGSINTDQNLSSQLTNDIQLKTNYGFSIEGKQSKRIPPESLYFSFPILFENDYKYIVSPDFFSDDEKEFSSELKKIIVLKEYSFLLQYRRTKLGSFDLTKKVDRLIELMVIYNIKYNYGVNNVEGVLSGFDYYLHSYFSALSFVIRYINEMYDSTEDEAEIKNLMRTVTGYDFTEESDLLILLEFLAKKLNMEKRNALEGYGLKKLTAVWEYTLTMIGIMRDIKELFSVIPSDKVSKYPLKYGLYPDLNSTKSKVENLTRRLNTLEFSITESVLDIGGEERPDRFSIGKMLNLGKLGEIGDEFDDDIEEEEGEGEAQGEGEEEEGEPVSGEREDENPIQQNEVQEFQEESKGVFYDIYLFYKKYLDISFATSRDNIDKIDDMYVYFLMQILFKDENGPSYSSLLNFQTWPQDSTLRMYPELNVQAYLDTMRNEE